MPTIYRQVFITKCDPTHNCGMSFESFRNATRMSKCSRKLDIKTLNGVVNMMKIDPHLPPRHMRSLLNGCVPKHIVLDAAHLRNFRRRCQLYHAANPDSLTINNNNAELLMSKVKVSGKELKVLDDPLVVSNFQKIYSNIMKSGTHTWKALLFL